MQFIKAHKFGILFWGIFLGFLLIGFLQIRQYGMPCDEGAEIKILASNVREYARTLQDEETQELMSWAPYISESIERDHGESCYYPFIPLLFMRCHDKIKSRNFMILYHIYTFLLNATAIPAMYLVLRELNIKKYLALFGAYLYILTPRMYADSFINNKDIVLLTLSLWSFWAGIRMLKQNKLRYAVMLAVLGGFATNTRIIGCLVIGIWGLAYLTKLLICRRDVYRYLRNGILCILIYLLTYFLVTPASFPEGLIKQLQYCLSQGAFYPWELLILFEGTVYKASLLPKRYILKMICLTTPVFILVGIFAAHVILGIQFIKAVKNRSAIKEINWYLFPLFIWIPILYVTFSHVILYNGWRHLYFTYGAMIILFIYTVHTLYEHLQKPRMKHGLSCLLGIGIVYLVIVNMVYFPCGNAYYNILAGRDADKKYELDYWNTDAYTCLKEFMKIVQPEDTIVLCGTDYMSENGCATNIPIMEGKYKDKMTMVKYQETSADYIFVNYSYYYARAMVEAIENPIYDKEPVYILKRGGKEIMGIYSNK